MPRTRSTYIEGSGRLTDRLDPTSRFGIRVTSSTLHADRNCVGGRGQKNLRTFGMDDDDTSSSDIVPSEANVDGRHCDIVANCTNVANKKNRKSDCNEDIAHGDTDINEPPSNNIIARFLRRSNRSAGLSPDSDSELQQPDEQILNLNVCGTEKTKPKRGRPKKNPDSSVTPVDNDTTLGKCPVYSLSQISDVHKEQSNVQFNKTTKYPNTCQTRSDNSTAIVKSIRPCHRKGKTLSPWKAGNATENTSNNESHQSRVTKNCGRPKSKYNAAMEQNSPRVDENKTMNSKLVNEQCKTPGERMATKRQSSSVTLECVSQIGQNNTAVRCASSSQNDMTLGKSGLSRRYSGTGIPVAYKCPETTTLSDHGNGPEKPNWKGHECNKTARRQQTISPIDVINGNNIVKEKKRTCDNKSQTSITSDDIHKPVENRRSFRQSRLRGLLLGDDSLDDSNSWNEIATESPNGKPWPQIQHAATECIHRSRRTDNASSIDGRKDGTPRLQKSFSKFGSLHLSPKAKGQTLFPENVSKTKTSTFSLASVPATDNMSNKLPRSTEASDSCVQRKQSRIKHGFIQRSANVLSTISGTSKMVDVQDAIKRIVSRGGETKLVKQRVRSLEIIKQANIWNRKRRTSSSNISSSETTDDQVNESNVGVDENTTDANEQTIVTTASEENGQCLNKGEQISAQNPKHVAPSQFKVTPKRSERLKSRVGSESPDFIYLPIRKVSNKRIKIACLEDDNQEIPVPRYLKFHQTEDNKKPSNPVTLRYIASVPRVRNKAPNHEPIKLRIRRSVDGQAVSCEVADHAIMIEHEKGRLNAEDSDTASEIASRLDPKESGTENCEVHENGNSCCTEKQINEQNNLNIASVNGDPGARDDESRTLNESPDMAVITTDKDDDSSLQQLGQQITARVKLHPTEERSPPLQIIDQSSPSKSHIEQVSSQEKVSPGQNQKQSGVSTPCVEPQSSPEKASPSQNQKQSGVSTPCVEPQSSQAKASPSQNQKQSGVTTPCVEPQSPPAKDSLCQSPQEPEPSNYHTQSQSSPERSISHLNPRKLAVSTPHLEIQCPEERPPLDHDPHGLGRNQSDAEQSSPQQRTSFCKSSMNSETSKAEDTTQQPEPIAEITDPETDAFILWSSDHRRGVENAHPKFGSDRIEAILKRHWHKVADKERSRYHNRVRRARTVEVYRSPRIKTSTQKISKSPEKPIDRINGEKGRGRTGEINQPSDDNRPNSPDPNSANRLKRFRQLSSEEQDFLIKYNLVTIQNSLTDQEFQMFERTITEKLETACKSGHLNMSAGGIEHEPSPENTVSKASQKSLDAKAASGNVRVENLSKEKRKQSVIKQSNIDSQAHTERDVKNNKNNVKCAIDTLPVGYNSLTSELEIMFSVMDNYRERIKSAKRRNADSRHLPSGPVPGRTPVQHKDVADQLEVQDSHNSEDHDSTKSQTPSAPPSPRTRPPPPATPPPATTAGVHEMVRPFQHEWPTSNWSPLTVKQELVQLLEDIRDMEQDARVSVQGNVVQTNSFESVLHFLKGDADGADCDQAMPISTPEKCCEMRNDMTDCLNITISNDIAMYIGETVRPSQSLPQLTLGDINEVLESSQTPSGSQRATTPTLATKNHPTPKLCIDDVTCISNRKKELSGIILNNISNLVDRGMFYKYVQTMEENEEEFPAYFLSSLLLAEKLNCL